MRIEPIKKPKAFHQHRGKTWAYERRTGLFQSNPADRLTLFVVHKVGIDLGGCHVLVDEHLANSIDIRARSNLQRGISMPEAMEGDVLLPDFITFLCHHIAHIENQRVRYLNWVT